jgi:hypothetical protein
MLVRPNIRRGSDATFKIYLRDSFDRPYDLTGWTRLRVRLPKENIGAVEVNSDAIPAAKAYATIQVDVGGDLVSVRFEAVTGGEAGNDIELVFNGTDTLDDVVGAWNTANPTNTVSHDADDGTIVPEAQTVALDQGLDSYYKVYPSSPLQLGEVNVVLSEADTSLLKIGRTQAVEITIDKGNHPAGKRVVVLCKDSIAVEERFF